MTRDFPTCRAWFTLANRDPRVGGGVLALIPAAMLLFFPLCLLSQLWPFVRGGCWARGIVESRIPLAALVDRPVVLAGVLAHGGGNRGGPMHSITYRFTDQQGTIRHGSETVSQRIWNGLRTGDTVDVLYLTTKPQTSRLWMSMCKDLRVAGVMSTFACVMLTVSGVMSLRGLQSVGREVRLLREGTSTLGTITAVDCQSEGRNSYVQKMTFEYNARTSLAGPVETMTGHFAARGTRRTPVEAGEKMMVCYDARSPEVCTLDWHSLRPHHGDRG